MSNSLLEDSEETENQDCISIIKSRQKKNLKFLKITLLAVGILLGTAFTPQPIQAKAKPTYELTPEIALNKEETKYITAQNKSEVETSFSEAEIRKGKEKVNSLIRSYESQYSTTGKNALTQEELEDTKTVVSALKGLDRDLLGNYADKIEISSYKTSDFNIIFANDEIIHCEEDNIDITDNVIEGEKKVRAKVAQLKCDFEETGYGKFEVVKENDNKKASYFDNFLITKEEIQTLLQTPNLNAENKTASQFSTERNAYLEEQETLLKKLATNIFLFNRAKDKCELKVISERELYILMVNERVCVHYEVLDPETRKWIVATETMQNLLNEQSGEQKYQRVFAAQSAPAACAAAPAACEEAPVVGGVQGL